MFQRVILPQCPNCKQKELKTIESRTTAQSTRRRKQCNACGYRITTHEVSADFFEEAKQNQITIKQMCKLLSAELPVIKPMNKCSDCQYNVDNMHCSFDLPEYDTQDAYDCNHYKLFVSK